MRRVPRVLAIAFLAFGVALTWAAENAHAEESCPVPCILVWSESRYVIGYNHIVHVLNGCGGDATCTVVTNINPEPQVVAVASHTHATVTTWLGSPSQYFVPVVSCDVAK